VPSVIATDVSNGADAHGRPLRSHVDRVIEPGEVAAVRRLFDLYASAQGLKRLAKLKRDLYRRRRPGRHGLHEDSVTERCGLATT
jgi:hypothetical protein